MELYFVRVANFIEFQRAMSNVLVIRIYLLAIALRRLRFPAAARCVEVW
jgi:hypothetical protein